MMVLAVESAVEQAGVALVDEDGVLASVTVARHRRHAESIAPAIEFVCRRVGVRLGALDAIGVDVGPGLFTGLRVGVGTAKALAFALEKPLIGVGSLEVLAHAVATSGIAPDSLVVPVVDARRGEVFVARLRSGAGAMTWEQHEQRRTPEALVEELRGIEEPMVLVGNGARRYHEVLRAVPGARLAGPSLDFPPPGVLGALVVTRAAAGEASDVDGVLPLYLRDAETRINWQTRAPRAAVER